MGFVRSLARPPRAQTGFAGAAQNRLTLDWIMAHRSADQEIRGELRTLRSRSRELVRNTGLVRRYVRLLDQNVIGPHGIRLQARMHRADKMPLTAANDAVELAFEKWGKLGTCTVDGKHSWRGLQRLVMRTLAGDGEVLIRLIRGFDNPFGFALQLLDADQLDEQYNVQFLPGTDGHEIRMGVEVNRWGRPVAYWLWDGHPSEGHKRGQRRRVPAEELLFLGEPDRPAQTRHVPWIASVMLDLNMLRGYYEAELVAARVAAAQGGWFESKPDDLGDSVEGDEATDPLTLEMEPGTWTQLPKGLTAKESTPKHPTTAFPEFVKAVLRTVATGLGVSYNALANDLEGVNYSSIRAGMLDERDAYRTTQQWLIEQFHQRVYEAWLPWAMLSGRLDSRVPLARYEQVSWQPRGWAWVDPEKDVDAAIKAIDRQMGSRQQVLAQQGVEFEEVLDDLAVEDEMIRAKGLDPTPPEPTPAAAPASRRRRPDGDQDEVDAILSSANGHDRPAWVHRLERVL
jgi:lambda family phage portal protein